MRATRAGFLPQAAVPLRGSTDASWQSLYVFWVRRQTMVGLARDLRSPDSIVVLLRDSESRDEARLLLLSFLQTLASVAKRRGPAAFVQHAPSLAGGGVASGMLVARPPKNDQKSAKDHPR